MRWLVRPTLAALVLLAACARRAPPAPTDAAADLLRAWARAQLDLRTWRSCARSSTGADPDAAVAVFPVDAEGKVGTVALEPAIQASDPALICLQLELAAPPETVPHQGEARTIRLPLRELHETAAPTGD